MKNPRYIRYHDEEWGRPHYDDGYLFELLVLESFQAGLSWECILNKRESFRTAFDGFDCRKVAAYTQEKMDALAADPSIVRNRRKIAAAAVSYTHLPGEREMAINTANIIGALYRGLRPAPPPVPQQVHLL